MAEELDYLDELDLVSSVQAELDLLQADIIPEISPYQESSPQSWAVTTKPEYLKKF